MKTIFFLALGFFTDNILALSWENMSSSDWRRVAMFFVFVIGCYYFGRTKE